MSKIDLETLKSHLWESANILRGGIDASDYKNYIFGMLFLKRLSDVFDEESEKLTQNLGEHINKANEALEENNPEMLEGVLSTVDFNDKDRLPDVILSALIVHFSKILLANQNLECLRIPDRPVCR